MSNVTLFIGGRNYTVACAEGEEDHVGRLGQLIDSTLETMPHAVAHSETRSLLFAALLLADELNDLRQTASDHTVSEEEATLVEVIAPASTISTAALDALAGRLERLADLIDQAN